MKQITATSVVEALKWVNENAHFEIGVEEHATKLEEHRRTGQDGSSITWKQPLVTHIFLRNHFEKMRVPQSLRPAVFKHLEPNKRAFDTRMYALTRSGRKLLAKTQVDDKVVA